MMKKILDLLSLIIILVHWTCEPELPDLEGKAPLADFTVSTNTTTTGQSIQFTDQSVNVPTTWTWSFGDGSTSTLQNPLHTYNTSGSFTVSLTAKNNYGKNTKTITDCIAVSPAEIAPVADFTVSETDIVVGQSVWFYDHSLNNPTSWDWDFGDGNTSKAQNPTHSYASAGTYTVNLTATNAKGSNTKTRTDYMQVSQACSIPDAAFSASPVTITEDETVQFTDESTHVPTKWRWAFGDGDTSTLQHPAHTYIKSGTYQVTLTVSNSCGTNTETKDNYIVVNEKKSGSFTDARDGNSYHWIKIGDQTWMADNLAYLPSVSPSSTLGNINYYVYDYNGTNTNEAKTSSNYSTYGVLYNMASLLNGENTSNLNPSGIRGVCPSGWHLPSTAEWEELINFLGGYSSAGGSMKEEGTEHWAQPNTGATNESGFTALPGGHLNNNTGFENIQKDIYFGTSTGQVGSGYDIIILEFDNNSILKPNLDSSRGSYCRCVKDE